MIINSKSNNYKKLLMIKIKNSKNVQMIRIKTKIKFKYSNKIGNNNLMK